MARFLGFALIFVTVVVVTTAFVVPKFFLSSSYASERSTVIAAPPSEIHAVISDLTTWKDWTIWNAEIDPTVEYGFLGEPGQVGQSMTWVGEELGEGAMTIRSVSDERVTYTLEFAGMAPANVEFELAAKGDVTAVRWAMSGEMEGPPHLRWIALMMDALNGPAFEQGLANLKVRLEGEGEPGGGDA
ncbi:MAG: SRPBCC family protein [Planctomycetota bacterium]|nr:SRPBCC family protein [Planctomycetota bacterium]MEC8512801.1 SRPBCC family protein [Planctomycetota bacterium]